jgi:hypothetical protein
MKTTFVRSILLLSVLCFGFAVASSADTLTLKDGTKMEGYVVGENDEALVFELTFDNGAITTRRTYLKADIENVVRTPEEQKRKEKMEFWYGKVMRYQLGKNSFQSDYYDKVIKDVFEKYLSVFPESPHTKEVQDLKTQWEAERVKVGAGEVKRDGKWMTTAESEQMTQEQKALAAVDSARSLIGSKEYKLAWLQLVKAYKISDNPEVIKQMREVGRDAYFKYAEYLTMKENWIKGMIDHLERRGARANVSAANLAPQATFATGSEISVSGDDERVLRSAEVHGDAVRAAGARTDQTIAEFKTRLAQVQDEIAQLKQKKADWDAGMEVGGLKKSDVAK